MLSLSILSLNPSFLQTGWHNILSNPGDIIFMGEFNKNLPTHIAIYVKEENNNIYFIDSTKKEAVDGQPAINGVTERFYDKGDKRFKHFAKMKLLKK